MEPFSLLTAFFLGLLGGAHCIGMCGGIIGALSMSIAADQTFRRWLIIITYNLGRILSYVFISMLFYVIARQLTDYFALNILRYIIAGLLLIAMGLYLADWWRGLTYLEKAGAYLWRRLQPLSSKLIPVTRYSQAFTLGILWGWLPCGLIYSALVYSATANSVLYAALIMFCFALGTLPAILATGLFAERITGLIRFKALRRLFAILIIIFGVWTLFGSLVHSHGSHLDHSDIPMTPASEGHPH